MAANRRVMPVDRNDLRNGGVDRGQAVANLLNGWTVVTNVAIRTPAKEQVAVLRESHKQMPVQFVDLWVPPLEPSIPVNQIAKGLAIALVEKELDRETLNFLSEGYFGLKIEDLVEQMRTPKPVEEKTEEAADQETQEPHEEVGPAAGTPVVAD